MNSVGLQEKHMKLRGNGGGNSRNCRGRNRVDLIEDIIRLHEISKQLKKNSCSFQSLFFFKELSTSCLRARNKLISYQGLDLAE